MIRVAVFGAAGRMGRKLIQVLHSHEACELGVAIERSEHPLLDQDSGSVALGVQNQIRFKSIEHLSADEYDIGIDFTVPEVTLAHLDVCARLGRGLVIGTTGFTQVQHKQLRAHGSAIGLVCAPNMSVGVNLTFKLIEMAAKSMGQGADIEVIEAHHRNKLDAPSGTALKMGEILADALGRDLDACAVYGREGRTGVRDPNTIGFETIRAGDIVGDHSVLFASEGETLEISHRATSRINFARGAVQAAHWLSQQPAGLYDMQDVLGLRTR